MKDYITKAERLNPINDMPRQYTWAERAAGFVGYGFIIAVITWAFYGWGWL